MSGFSDYSAKASINWASGNQGMPAVGNRFLALFTTAPADDGTGAVEVTGAGYARVQVAGALAAGGSFTTASTTITLGATAPAWLLALGTNGSGVNVYDATNGFQIGTVSSISGTTVTLTGTAAHASGGASDSLIFSAFPGASGSAPSSAANAAQVNFAQATADWTGGGASPVVAFGLYDALTVGNLIEWDYLGNNAWKPFSCTSASPGVLTVPAHGFANGDNVVVTAEYGGALPSTAGSWSGLKTVASASTDTFTAGVNTTGTGSGMVRKVVTQAIPANVTASFAASAITLSAA